MPRIHAFEIHELRGCPDVVRRLATDYLHSVGEAFKAFEPMAPLLSAALATSGQRTVPGRSLPWPKPSSGRAASSQSSS
jgi:hypothetical protein